MNLSGTGETIMVSLVMFEILAHSGTNTFDSDVFPGSTIAIISMDMFTLIMYRIKVHVNNIIHIMDLVGIKSKT